MELNNLFYVADVGSELEIAGKLCDKFSGIVQIFGYIFLLIKIITPILLIVVGMLNMTKAIASKDEEAIKKSQRGLVKKIIAAVSVFLVITLVNFLMGMILNNTDYSQCASCFNKPGTCSTSVSKNNCNCREGFECIDGKCKK